MIVYDISVKDTYQNVIGWFNDVVDLLPNTSLVLVGNKIDSTRKVLSSKAVLFTEKNNIPFFEVSASTGEHVERAFRSLIETPSIPSKDSFKFSLKAEEQDIIRHSSSFYFSDGQPKHLKYMSEDVTSLGWKQHKKHFFILSDAGKPIFSRYGKEEDLSPMMGLLVGIVSVMNVDSDPIRTIYSGQHKIVFLVKGPVIFVCVSSTTEPESELFKQLELLYNQIIFILTEKVIQILKQKAQFDLRRLLGGTDNVLHSLIYQMSRGMSYSLLSTRTLYLPKNQRQQVGDILLKYSNHENTVISFLMSVNHIIHLVKNKKYTFQAQDLLLLLNFVNSNKSFRISESWTPVCLPLFDSKGFFYAYISYIKPEICLVMINITSDNFEPCLNAKKSIVSSLEKTGLIDELVKASYSPYQDPKDYKVGDVRHFVYKSGNLNQFLSTSFSSPYNSKKEKKRLIRCYKTIRDRLKTGNINQQKQYFLINEKESIFVSINQNEELYVTYPLTITKSSAMDSCESIKKMIQKEEENIFISNFLNF